MGEDEDRKLWLKDFGNASFAANSPEIPGSGNSGVEGESPKSPEPDKGSESEKEPEPEKKPEELKNKGLLLGSVKNFITRRQCPSCGRISSVYNVDKGIIKLTCKECGHKWDYNLAEVKSAMSTHNKTKPTHSSFILYIFLRWVGRNWWKILAVLVVLYLLFVSGSERMEIYKTDLVDAVVVVPFTSAGRFVSDIVDSAGTKASDMWLYWTDPAKYGGQGDLKSTKTDGESYSAVEIYDEKTGQEGIMSVSMITKYVVAYQNLGLQTPKELYLILSLGEELVENGGYILPKGIVDDDGYNAYYDMYTPTRALKNVSRMPKYYENSDVFGSEVFMIRSPVCSGSSFPLGINVRYIYETTTDWDPLFRDRDMVEEKIRQAKDEDVDLKVSKAASGPVDIVISSLMDQIVIGTEMKDGEYVADTDMEDIVFFKFGLMNYRDGVALVDKVMWRLPEFLEIVEDGTCELRVVDNLDPDYDFMDHSSGYVKYVPSVYDDEKYISLKVIDGSSISERKVFFCSFRYNATVAEDAGFSLPMEVHMDAKLRYYYEVDYTDRIEVDDKIGIIKQNIVKCGTDEAKDEIADQLFCAFCDPNDKADIFCPSCSNHDLVNVIDSFSSPWKTPEYDNLMASKAALRGYLIDHAVMCAQSWSIDKDAYGYIPSSGYLPCGTLYVKFDNKSCKDDDFDVDYFDADGFVSKVNTELGDDSKTIGAVYFSISDTPKDNVIETDNIYEISFSYYDTFVTKYDSVVIGMKSVIDNTNCNRANLEECKVDAQCITGNCDAASGLCQPVP